LCWRGQKQLHITWQHQVKQHEHTGRSVGMSEGPVQSMSGCRCAVQPQQQQQTMCKQHTNKDKDAHADTATYKHTSTTTNKALHKSDASKCATCGCAAHCVGRTIHILATVLQMLP
jgi:hypothetical protein